MTSLYAGPCGCSCSIKASAVPVDCQDFNGGKRCEENGPSLTLAVLCKGPPGLADLFLFLLGSTTLMLCINFAVHVHSGRESCSRVCPSSCRYRASQLVLWRAKTAPTWKNLYQRPFKHHVEVQLKEHIFSKVGASGSSRENSIKL